MRQWQPFYVSNCILHLENSFPQPPSFPYLLSFSPSPLSLSLSSHSPFSSLSLPPLSKIFLFLLLYTCTCTYILSPHSSFYTSTLLSFTSYLCMVIYLQFFVFLFIFTPIHLIYVNDLIFFSLPHSIAYTI